MCIFLAQGGDILQNLLLSTEAQFPPLLWFYFVVWTLYVSLYNRPCFFQPIVKRVQHHTLAHSEKCYQYVFCTIIYISHFQTLSETIPTYFIKVCRISIFVNRQDKTFPKTSTNFSVNICIDMKYGKKKVRKRAKALIPFLLLMLFIKNWRRSDPS